MLASSKTAFRCLSTTATSADPKFDFEKIRNEIIQNWLNAEAASPAGTQIRARYCTFTYLDGVRAYQEPRARWHWLDRELSSNLAGETGAVSIYQGALKALSFRNNKDRDTSALEFCKEHMRNETNHLKLFERIVGDDKNKHTRLLPMWRLAGWMLGFVPTAVGGRRALYVTVQAVESFVEEHFQEQIIPLKDKGSAPELVKVLEYCCQEEVHHRQDAARRLLQDGDSVESLSKVWWVQPWSIIVQRGSSIAAEVARRV